MRSLVYIVMFFLAFGLFSCQKKEPKWVIPQGEMEALLIDIHITDAMLQNDYKQYNTASKKAAMYDAVFKKHHVTKQQVDTSLYWYGSHPDVYIKMYERINKQLTDRRKKAEKHVLSSDKLLAEAGDTINIWNENRWQLIQPIISKSAQFTTTIKTDTAFYAGDMYEWKMHLRGVASVDSLETPSQALLIFVFPGDSLVINRKVITQDGLFEFDCKSDSIVPEKIHANVYFNMKNSPNNRIFVDSIQLLRIHAPKP